jgi:hypothetical protein
MYWKLNIKVQSMLKDDNLEIEINLPENFCQKNCINKIEVSSYHFNFQVFQVTRAIHKKFLEFLSILS